MDHRRIAQLLRERARIDEALAEEFERDADAEAPEKPARKSKPRRRRTVTPHPEAGVEFDDLALARARRMIGK